MLKIQNDRYLQYVQQLAPCPQENDGASAEDERALNIDFALTEAWSVTRIMNEFVEGFDKLAHIPPTVAIFGSSRARPEEPAYLAAVEMARLLAQAGFGIITGGGPGIMEAGNKGAQEGRSTSIGCNIELLVQEQPNAYLDISLGFRW
jgi:hypothetical protein